MAAVTTYDHFPTRRYARKFLSGRAIVFVGDKSNIADSVQVSEGGILVGCRSDVPLDIHVTVHFTILTRYIRAKARVIYRLEPNGSNSSPRFGLAFTEISEDEREWIRKYTGPLSR